MHTLQFTMLAWGLLAAFLIGGLVLYERTGLRLGGVLVLPLLLVYALIDLNIVAVFALAAAIALVVGQIIHRTTLIYGRRLLYVFLIVGILATFFARHYVEVALAGFIVGLLPGLFAYNLHREGRYLEGASAFALWFGLFLVAALATLWLIAQPDDVVGRVQAAAHAAFAANLHDAPAALETMREELLPAALALASGMEAFRDGAGAAE